ncbi:MAG: DUF177 domain-containing protein [Endomicrobia bacterium]|nr:DUF177 domain-containing protein [Endomicrobiia bacterium]MCX7941457.1 DUF177 domain-containing protein [Endomicrobiia bacterium]MDW8055439.1 DUF177 domain-containing protein [Elusimicrobiota bacterium]
MKISIDRIKKEGVVDLEYEDEQFQKKGLREFAEQPLKIKVTLRLVGSNNISVKGDIDGEFSLICDRCCEEFVHHKHLIIDEVFELDKKELSERMVNLDLKIRDYVLESFPIKILCKEDCKGICSGCGVNLNTQECKCRFKNK